MTLHAGFLDVGTKHSSQHGRVAIDEIEIIASIMQAKDDDELNFYSVRLEREDETVAASSTTQMRSRIDKKHNVDDAERRVHAGHRLSVERGSQPATELTRDASTTDGISVVQNDGTFGQPTTVPMAIAPTVGTLRAPNQGDDGLETTRASAGVSTRNLLVNGDFEARRAPGQISSLIRIWRYQQATWMGRREGRREHTRFAYLSKRQGRQTSKPILGV